MMAIINVKSVIQPFHQRKEQEHDVVIGPHEQILNESLKELKMSTERYFAGDAMTGNKECNAYIRALGEMTTLFLSAFLIIQR